MKKIISFFFAIFFAVTPTALVYADSSITYNVTKAPNPLPYQGYFNPYLSAEAVSVSSSVKPNAIYNFQLNLQFSYSATTSVLNSFVEAIAERYYYNSYSMTGVFGDTTFPVPFRVLTWQLQQSGSYTWLYLNCRVNLSAFPDSAYLPLSVFADSAPFSLSVPFIPYDFVDLLISYPSLPTALYTCVVYAPFTGFTLDFSFENYNVYGYLFDFNFGYHTEDYVVSGTSSLTVNAFGRNQFSSSTTVPTTGYISAVTTYTDGSGNLVDAQPLVNSVRFITATPSDNTIYRDYLRGNLSDRDFSYDIDVNRFNIVGLSATAVSSPEGVSGKYYRSCQSFDLVCWLNNAIVYLLFDFPLLKPLTSLFTPIFDIFSMIIDLINTFSALQILVTLIIGLLAINFILKAVFK